MEAEKEKTKDENKLPNARIETIKENIETHSLKPEQVREYCERLFQFKKIKVLRFKSWSERRQFSKKSRHKKQLERPMLPDGIVFYRLKIAFRPLKCVSFCQEPS